MSFTIINELDYKTTGPRIVEKNKVAVFKNTQGNIIGENTENIKINNGIEISNENNTGSIILEPSSSSISQTLTFPATKGTLGQILENDGSGQLSWVNNGGGGGSGDVKGPVGSTDTAIAIYDGTTGKKIKNTGVTIDGTDNISTTGTVSGATNSTFGTLTLADGSITDSGGTISFGTDNISTTGTVSGATNSTFGTLTLADGSITDSGGTISFDDENISTTGTITTTGINLDPVDATNTGEIKFKELSTTGTNYISLKASDSIDNDVSLTLPSADTTIPRYVLGSDASGNLDWYNRADLWATNTSYSQNDVVIAEYESEYRFFIALNSFTSTGSPFPGSQTIYIPPSGTGTNWQEISPFRGAIEGQISFAASLTPSALTGDVDNYNPNGLGSTNFLRLQTDGGNYTISGIAAPVPVVNQGIFIVNIGSTGNIQLLNNNSSSDTGNRFLIGGNKTIQDDEGIMLIYDDVSNRWRSQAIQI
jgi:hypothetical protein